MPDTSRMKPEFVVSLDGAKLAPDEAGAILGIRIYQTRQGANSCEIVVSDPDLKWQGKPTFTECKEVKIELGVPGKLRSVFDGEVTAWRTELERNGPTVLVVRGMDRSHRLMRADKTRNYPNATPLDVARQIAADHGLTARVSGGTPAPIQTFRVQANQTDFEFLRQMADLEGYLFWIDGKDLHFERPQLSSTHDCEFSFGEDLKTFLPVADFRKAAQSVEVGAWDTAGKAEITGTATTGDELWSVAGQRPGAELSRFGGAHIELSLVESQVATQDHADTVAKAALTRRAMEFITAEVEVQGDPVVRPGALVNLKNVGPFSGMYLVNEANHFYDSGGYNCIFYVARDKWGNSANTAQQQRQARQQQQAQSAAPPPRTAQPAVVTDGIHRRLVDEDTGDPLANVEYEISLHGGEKRKGKTDADGYLQEEDVPQGNFTIRILRGDVEVFGPVDEAPEVEASFRKTHADVEAEREATTVAHVAVVSAAPRRLFEGKKVVLRATVLGAEDGAEVAFRVFRLDEADPVATLQASVDAGVARIEWTVEGGSGSGVERGVPFADFDVEAECLGSMARAPELPAFRSFQSAPQPQAGPAGTRVRLVHALVPGEPLARVRVQVRYPDGREVELETDDDGYLDLGAAPEGDYEVSTVGAGSLALLVPPA